MFGMLIPALAPQETSSFASENVAPVKEASTPKA